MYAEILVVIAVGESMNRMVEGQIRTMHKSLEAVLQMSVTIDFAVITWMERHAAWVLTRYQVRSDGFTTYQKFKKRAAQARPWPLNDQSAGCR